MPQIKKPNKFITVPAEFRRRTYLSEKNMIVNDVKTATGCEVIPQWDNGHIHEFGIVGAGAGLEKAVIYINQWILRAHIKSADSTAWPKTSAFNGTKWYYHEVEEKERARKQRFKDAVPADTSGLSSVSLLKHLFEYATLTKIRLLFVGLRPFSIRPSLLETSSRTNSKLWIVLG